LSKALELQGEILYTDNAFQGLNKDNQKGQLSRFVIVEEEMRQ